MHLIDRVRRLQEIDAEILRIERAFQQDYPSAEGRSRDRVEAAKTALATHKEEIRKLRMNVDKGMVKLKAEEDRARDLEIQLNKAKSNREYAAIQHQIASLRADASLIEEDVYRQLEQIEELEARSRDFEKTLEEAEGELRETSEEIDQCRRKDQARLQELQARRAEVVESFESLETLRLYERILEARGGQAVVAVSGDTCQGCYMTVSPNTVAQVAARKFPVLCSSCGRLLYMED